LKVLTILGARPQFIKAATISRVIRRRADIEECIVHTGQHFDVDMSDVFFEQLDIPRPHHHLHLANLGHGAMTGRMLEALEKVMLLERPDIVLVYGDTNSTLAGALAAAKVYVPVAHVEAGLRSGNPRMPEEVNRVLTDRVAAVLFCPTKESMRNLEADGFPHPSVGRTGSVGPQQAFLVGDVMYDAVLYYRERVRREISLSPWGLEDGRYALCTLHRQENTDDAARLGEILHALRQISEQLPVIIPLHPRTRQRLAAGHGPDDLGQIRTIGPVPYLEMHRLVMGAQLVLTDSGGLQKEAYFHGVPCVTLRDETEWVETVAAGWNTLAGASSARILTAVGKRHDRALARPPLYGDGDAAERIVSTLVEWGM
jgi:UDP-GlcNAc3NAcA epimerase